MICGIIKINAKVTSDDEFMRHGSSRRKERIKVFEKHGVWSHGVGLETVGDEGGR